MRFEALLSIARMRSEVRLREALIETLHDTEPALAAMAAWALGRMGDMEAVAPLRLALDSPYHSIRAHSARAMGAMGCKEMAPLIRERLVNESDKGLQMACASALGSLRDHEATDGLLTLLQDTTIEKARLELALTLSRLVGDEHHFVHPVCHMRNDLGTTVAQELIAFKHRLERRTKTSNGAGSCLADCTNAFAHHDRNEGITKLVQLVHSLPLNHFDATSWQILTACTTALESPNEQHLEYFYLALHILHAGSQQ